MFAPLNELFDVAALSQKLCPEPIQAELLYATPYNFIGRPIAGYVPGVKDFALLTRVAAEALCAVQNNLLQNHNLRLRIYDSYRPKRAVNDFMAWSNEPVANNEQGRFELIRKKIHYPHIEKNQLFELGYVAEDSQHCYGHTVDLVLIDDKNQEVNLGACFDFMDTLSHITCTAADIGEEALHHREILSTAMQKFDFVPYVKEFWHFSHAEKTILEPIDIIISEDLKGLNVV